MIRQNFEVTY